MVEILQKLFHQLKCEHLVLCCNLMETLIPIVKQGGVKRTCLPLHIVELLLIESP